MIDSHTHLDLCEDPAQTTVAEAVEAGVNRLLTVCTDAASCETVLKLAEQFPQVYAAVGLHPNSSEGFALSEVDRLRQAATHPRCVAVGETGLDYYREGASRDDQHKAFIAQIELAAELAKPLVIHTRSADQDTLAVLDQYASGLKVVIHCFSMPDRLEECLERDFWISFAGNATYPNAKELMEAAIKTPLDRILVETDAPYLAPQIVRGQRNRPAHVVATAQAIAEARGIPYVELEQAVESNAAQVFGW